MARTWADARLLGRSRRLLVVIHDNRTPMRSPGACALSGWPRRKPGARRRICCEPIAGRAENRALIRELRLSRRPVSRVNWSQWPVTALLVTQPGEGNNSVPVGPRAGHRD